MRPDLVEGALGFCQIVSVSDRHLQRVEGLPWVPDRPTLGSRFSSGLCQVPVNKMVSGGFPGVFRFPQLLCLSLTRLPVGAFIGNAMQNTENARRFVHLARTSTISSLNPNESSPGRAGKALEKRETERVSGSGWRVAHTRRAGGRVSQSRKGLRSWAG